MSQSRVCVTRLSHVHYQYPNLEKSLSFLSDFGLESKRNDVSRVYLGGYGQDPFLVIAEQSPDSKRHFIGGFWVVDSFEELEKTSQLPSATPIENLDAPGGGKVVRVTDPNGFIVGFVHGQVLKKEVQDVSLEVHGESMNTATVKTRRGQTRRFMPGPSPVHKLGHYGYTVPKSKFESTLDWYKTTLNLSPTDSVFDPATGKDETTFCHIDLGSEYTDHHVRYLVFGPVPLQRL
ncbi:MAG: hypothetical protein CL912_33010 [Deltaproteobacteria bacterium]|nr:hypothetical protein [Deltaproteobacteria bacterium]